MTSPGGDRLRVALSAAPVLLSDSLRTLLVDVADVTILLDEPGPVADAFDVAIVTPTAPHIPADVTIVLDDARTTRGGGTVQRAGDTCTEHLDDLSEVVAFVGSAAAKRSATSGRRDTRGRRD